MDTNSLWFDPTGNRARVYRFSRKRSIYSVAGRNGIEIVADATSGDEEKLGTLCFDQLPNCNQLTAFCGREPLVQTLCPKSCQVCSDVDAQGGKGRGIIQQSFADS